MNKHIIVMGVSGCGKSTVGQELAQMLDATFYDGDDFHPQANVEKMASGKPLTDADRQPWLEELARVIGQTQGSSVTACSALKKQYRDTLRSAGNVTFVYLDGSREILLERMQKRSTETEHFMPSSLLDSQLATLENPSNEPNTITVSIEPSISTIIENVFTKL